MINDRQLRPEEKFELLIEIRRQKQLPDFWFGLALFGQMLPDDNATLELVNSAAARAICELSSQIESNIRSAGRDSGDGRVIYAGRRCQPNVRRRQRGSCSLVWFANRCLLLPRPLPLALISAAL